MSKLFYPPANTSSNYGVLTDISKGMNSFFGDSSGRTVSRRTTHGFMSIFKIEESSEEKSEFHIHLIMIACLFLAAMKNKVANIFAFILLICLIIFYWTGNNYVQEKSVFAFQNAE